MFFFEQVKTIRDALRKVGLGDVDVETIENVQGMFEKPIKDGDYYCYCAYVLRISRYSDFLSPVLTNTGIFLRGLKLSGESRS